MVGSRSRSAFKQRALRKFPIHVRCDIGPSGLGRKAFGINQWLKARVGKDNFAVCADDQPGHYEAFIVLPYDPTIIEPLLAEFDLELVAPDIRLHG